LSGNAARLSKAASSVPGVRHASGRSVTGAPALGYQGAEDLMRRRYIEAGATVAELAAALGCAEITVITEMDRLGVPRRPQLERLAQGREALAAQRAQVRAEREARVRELGFDDLASYLRTRLHAQR
jgi:hypothetical protein